MSDAAASFWERDELAKAAGGRWLGSGVAAGSGQRVRGVSVDSRSIAPGQAFVAVRGERFDGHDYVLAAHEAGAGIAIVDNAAHPQVRQAAERWPVLIVEDTRQALAVLAAAYRDRLEALVVGVTGSNGKTSTVRMLDAVFRSAGWRTAASIKSFNNEIGVPLTVLNAPPDTEVLICELGTNNPGEIATLGAMVRPDVAAVTSIGRAHLGRFGSVAAIAREKLSLLRFVGVGLGEHAGLALVPGLGAEPGVIDVALDDLNEAAALQHVQVRRVRAGAGDEAGLGVRYALVGSDDAGVVFRVEEHESSEHEATAFRVPLHGSVMAGNGAMAVTIARWAGIEDAAIASGLLDVVGAEGRMVVREHQRRDGVRLRVLDDCYNASPESMAAALAEASRQASELGAARVLVLGEMGEMGEHAEAMHRALGRSIAAEAFVQAGDAVVGVGNGARWIIEETQRLAGVRCAAVERVGEPLDAAVDAAVGQAAAAGHAVVVLIKGSRSVGLEGVGQRLMRS